MTNIVGVTRGTDKFESFTELLTLTSFDDTLMQALEKSNKNKSDFKIVIKPNMMSFLTPKAFKAIVTDKELVEYLVDHIIKLGFSDISVCEAQNDGSTMLKNHNVEFVSHLIGYAPEGRYKIVDLTLEALPFKYVYKNKKGQLKTWKDEVGKTWKEADFRIAFAKCKTHEQDWMTLGIKVIYGCFPRPGKTSKYHIKDEVEDVTARSLRNFPVHFSFIDGWLGSDGYQGYKIERPKPLKMLFGGENIVAVDMEVFKRAGLDSKKSELQEKAVEQLYDGAYPQYVVKGDKETMFSDICEWENIKDELIKCFDNLEEIYVVSGFLNLKVVSEVIDFDVFPPKNFFQRILVWIAKKIYRFLSLFGL
ncbi:MAG: DUF362 domain-containing protein [Candidatus Aminicenantes bacterium]|nr:MAG: DUF362 domain-containing protein [Candidatus Aminicenantes bacterium]